MNTVYVYIVILALGSSSMQQVEYREYVTLEQAKQCVEQEIKRWGQRRVLAMYKATKLSFAPTYERKKVSETFEDQLVGVDVREES